MVPKLSDTQAVLLAAAAARPGLSVLPAPEALRLKGAALERTLSALLGRGLIAAAPTAARAKMSKWVGGPDADAADRRRLIITAAGLEAIGVESAQAGDGTPDAVPAQRAYPETQRARPGGKLGVLLDAVSRPEGATLGDLSAAAGWPAAYDARRHHPAPPAGLRRAHRQHGDAQGLSPGPGGLIPMPGLSETGGADVAPPPAEALAARIEALPSLSIADLRQAWSAAWGRPPPKGARRRLLMLGIAWQWQAELYGGFSRSAERRLATLEAAFRQSAAPSPNRHRPSSQGWLVPGSRLIRVWKAERHEVEVTETGYLWRGRSWASLSSIARAITGVRRNGPAFFGLRDKDAP